MVLALFSPAHRCVKEVDMDIYSVIGLMLAPLAAGLIFGVIGGGIRLGIARYMPESWLKRQILKERFKSQYSAANAIIQAQADAHPMGWRHFIGSQSTQRTKGHP